MTTDNIKLLSRTISLVENEAPGYEQLLMQLPAASACSVIGITGPPGAGKSTITDALIGLLVNQGKCVAVLCVDPSSPFHYGALLGDRIRMSSWYNHPAVFIRSLASRGSLGGLHPKIIEITDVLKASAFDYIIIETVGVGQSEIEIAGLADVTIVVLIPGAGDDIQIMKAGLMEIASVFVVNKADRAGADMLVKNIHLLQHSTGNAAAAIPVIKTIASQKEGINELLDAVNLQLTHSGSTEKKYSLLAEKAYQLLVKKRMKNINKKNLVELIKEASTAADFNIYKWLDIIDI